jgi:hypothetical protein
MKAVMIVSSNVGHAQLFGVEEFNDPPFERHAYNSVIALGDSNVE